MIKVSFIVAVYNIETYIEKCLDSIRNQTLKDIEVIVVNDGSTDRSLELINKYCDDGRFKVINKENGGLSSARNKGVEYASGKYVLFVDGDDWIDNDMAEKLYNSCEKNDSDISICAIRYVFFDGREINRNFKPKKLDGINNIEALRLLFRSDGFRCHAVNKLFRKELLSDNIFPEGIVFEDVATIYKIILKAKKVSLIPDKLYNYLQARTGSILTSRFNSNKLVILDILKQIKLDLVKLNKFHLLSSEYEVFYIENIMSIISNYIKTSMNYRDNEVEILLKNEIKQIPLFKVVKNKNCKIQLKVKFFIAKISFSLYLSVFKACKKI